MLIKVLLTRRIKYCITVVFVLCCTLQYCSAEELSECYVPTGKAGYCVPVEQCTRVSVLFEKLQKPLLNEVDRYIKDSFFCKNEQNVCCQWTSIINPKPRTKPQSEDRGNIFSC